MTSIRGINASNGGTFRILGRAMRLEDSVPPSPTKANGTNLVRAGDHPYGVDKAINERLANALTVLEQPWRKDRGDRRGVLDGVDHTSIFFVLERRLYTLEERQWKRVALVDVGNIGVEASFGIVVC